MKNDTREWIAKAEADFATASRESRARSQPNHDAVCFHAQQCIEKYLKARLVAAGASFPKTHDLEQLLNFVLPHEPLWDAFRPMMIDLASFAVSFRYPGHSATRKLARTSLDNCRVIRKVIRASLG